MLKRFLVILLSLLMLGTASAQFGACLPAFCGAPPVCVDNTLSKSYTTTLSTAVSPAASTYTYTGVDFGCTGSSRVVVIAINTFLVSLGATIDSVTIGGVSATQASYIENTGQASASSVWYAVVPTGLTGDITINTSVNMSRLMVGVYRLSGLSSSAPVDTCTVQATTAALTHCDTDVASGGFIIAAQGNLLGAMSTFVGVTIDGVGDITIIGGSEYYAASYTDPSVGETPRTVTFDPSSIDRVTMATASWR